MLDTQGLHKGAELGVTSNQRQEMKAEKEWSERRENQEGAHHQHQERRLKTKGTTQLNSTQLSNHGFRPTFPSDVLG